MKKLLKSIVAYLAWRYVTQLRRKHDIRVIGVAGSIGKTGTKRAIARTLSQKYKVMWQDGNYNDVVSVPLVFFGLGLPSIFNPFAWLKTFGKMRSAIKDYEYQVVVLEIGTDAPGQIAQFSRYLELDLAIVTRLAPEHMEFFHTMQAVAEEELSIQRYARALIIDESTSQSFAEQLTMSYETYGIGSAATARFDYDGTQLVVHFDNQSYTYNPKLIGEHQMWALAAATLIGHKFRVASEDIKKAVESLEPMSGRMQLLGGKNGSTIIDDTYNAAPDAVIAALHLLQSRHEKNKIAVLGNMNELGSHSVEAHKAVAEALDASKISTLYTIGSDASSVLAGNAEQRGIKVIRANSPYEIGMQIEKLLDNDTVVLLKGSQNGVFLEEAIKSLLANPTDEQKLVRQNEYWISKKAKLFKKLGWYDKNL